MEGRGRGGGSIGVGGSGIVIGGGGRSSMDIIGRLFLWLLLRHHHRWLRCPSRGRGHGSIVVGRTTTTTATTSRTTTATAGLQCWIHWRWRRRVWRLFLKLRRRCHHSILLHDTRVCVEYKNDICFDMYIRRLVFL